MVSAPTPARRQHDQPISAFGRTHGAWRPLSPFQQIMLEWQRCGPYNAVHAVLADGPADLKGIARAVTATSRMAGVESVEFDAARQRYRYVSHDNMLVQLRVLDDLNDATVATVLAEQLNSPFPDEPHVPVRWLVLTRPNRDMHVVVASYNHVVADAYAIQAMVAQVCARRDGAVSADDGPPGMFVGDQGRPPCRPAARVGSFLALTRQYFRLRHAHRIAAQATQEQGCGICIADVPVTVPDDFRARAGAVGLGLNATIMGAVVKAVAEMTPRRKQGTRRKGLGISTVLSTRVSRPGEPIAFDVRLDNRTAFVAAPDDDLVDVAERIGAQIRRLGDRAENRESLAAGQSFAIRRVWSLLGIENNAASYRKLFPVCAGVSPFRVEESWYAPSGSRLLRVLRACPTGPALPVVLAATIRGSSVDLVLTFRRACFDDAQAALLLRRTVDHINEIVRRFT